MFFRKAQQERQERLKEQKSRQLKLRMAFCGLENAIAAVFACENHQKKNNKTGKTA